MKTLKKNEWMMNEWMKRRRAILELSDLFNSSSPNFFKKTKTKNKYCALFFFSTPKEEATHPFYARISQELDEDWKKMVSFSKHSSKVATVGFPYPSMYLYTNCGMARSFQIKGICGEAHID